jgi:hypothetical protein
MLNKKYLLLLFLFAVNPLQAKENLIPLIGSRCVLFPRGIEGNTPKNPEYRRFTKEEEDDMAEILMDTRIPSFLLESRVDEIDRQKENFFYDLKKPTMGQLGDTENQIHFDYNLMTTEDCKNSFFVISYNLPVAGTKDEDILNHKLRLERYEKRLPLVVNSFQQTNIPRDLQNELKKTYKNIFDLYDYLDSPTVKECEEYNASIPDILAAKEEECQKLEDDLLAKKKSLPKKQYEIKKREIYNECKNYKGKTPKDLQQKCITHIVNKEMIDKVGGERA